MDILDNQNILQQRDSEKTLDSAVGQPRQIAIPLEVVHAPSEIRPITQVVISGMGGSALAALLIKTWLAPRIKLPFEIFRSYGLPAYVGPDTLVIASSCSGNTEETISAYEAALSVGAQLAVVEKGGKLLEDAKRDGVAHIELPNLPIQPRMLTIAQLKALTQLLATFKLVDDSALVELTEACEWLGQFTSQWEKTVPFEQNRAKQMAFGAAGKTAVFFGGPYMAAAAYKWKISWNENAKNTAFWNEYPEFNHNEFMGWSSHPIEKPFAIYDIVSSLELPRIQQRFELSDRLLSGKRPKATVISPEGDTVLKQLLWVSLLADFVSIYLGILNNVDPGPVPLIEKFKKELD